MGPPYLVTVFVDELHGKSYPISATYLYPKKGSAKVTVSIIRQTTPIYDVCRVQLSVPNQLQGQSL